MGRVSRRAALLGATLVALVLLAGCENALTSFLLGSPYRREMAKLVPTPNSFGFGFAVDISGDYMIVGEPYRDGNKGGAWIYHRVSGETWDAGTLLPAPAGALGPDASNGNDGDLYGYAVATNGEYAVLGSMYAGDGGIKRGKVAIYVADTYDRRLELRSDFQHRRRAIPDPAGLRRSDSATRFRSTVHGWRLAHARTRTEWSMSLLRGSLSLPELGRNLDVSGRNEAGSDPPGWGRIRLQRRHLGGPHDHRVHTTRTSMESRSVAPFQAGCSVHLHFRHRQLGLHRTHHSPRFGTHGPVRGVRR